MKPAPSFRNLAASNLAALAALLLLIAAPAGAEPYTVGDQLAPFELPDQHDVVRSIHPSVEILLFSRNMDAGKIVKEALKDLAPGALEARNTVYVADISEMPGLVAKLFAIPSMRKRPYSMLLDRDGTTTARFPDGETRATLIHCNDLEVTQILFFDDPAELRNELGFASN